VDISTIVQTIFTGILLLYFGTVEKRISAMQAKLERKMDIDEVERTIGLEIKVVRNEQSNLKEDLSRIENKLDKLLDRLTKLSV
jgi:hypothetical protein